MWPFGRRHTKQVSRTRCSDAIVDSRLHAKHDLGRADLRNADFFGQAANRAHLGSQLLLYEHVIIPTNDFAIVPTLIQWLGQRHFEAALDRGALSFLRRTGLLGYAGNGNGISSFVISDTPEKPFLWWQKALFGELAEAIELQLIHGVPSLTKRQRDGLLRVIEGRSRSVTYDNDFFLRNIVQGRKLSTIVRHPLVAFTVAPWRSAAPRWPVDRRAQLERWSRRVVRRWCSSSGRPEAQGSG